MSRKKTLKDQVETQLSDMLESTEEPSEGRMKLLKLGITMLAVNAKLEEADFGSYFTDDKEPTTKSNGGTRLPAKDT